MNPDIAIRRFEVVDADPVSQLIVDNLTQVNVHDYGEPAVRHLATLYTPLLVCEYARRGEMYVAVRHRRVVGTATLDADRVRNVFVGRDQHRQGIGRLLMQAVESAARRQCQTRLVLDAAKSAVGFYRKQGYVLVAERDEPIACPSVRMFVMEKVFK